MLKLGGAAFTQGRSKFLDYHQDAPEETAKIFVRLLMGDLPSAVIAQLDTGAAWSVLDPEVATLLGLIDAKGFPAILDTRLGRKSGRLVKVPIRFLADEGSSFDTEGTFFICPDWPSGRTFLGYSGLLDSIRFALDAQKNHFYFGPAG
jgi:hypothetical protein